MNIEALYGKLPQQVVEMKLPPKSGPQGWENLSRRSCAKTVNAVSQNGHNNTPVEKPTKPVSSGVEVPAMGRINW